MKLNIVTGFSIMNEGRIEALDTPENLKKTICGQKYGRSFPEDCTKYRINHLVVETNILHLYLKNMNDEI